MAMQESVQHAVMTAIQEVGFTDTADTSYFHKNSSLYMYISETLCTLVKLSVH